MKKQRQIMSIIAAIALCGSLSSCAIIPVMDGRSPFDSPFGVSQGQIKKKLPILQEEILEFEKTMTQEDRENWSIEARKLSGNCEGECKLRLGIIINPKATQLNKYLSTGEIKEITKQEAGFGLEREMKYFSVDKNELLEQALTKLAENFDQKENITVEIRYGSSEIIEPEKDFYYIEADENEESVFKKGMYEKITLTV